MSPECEFSNVCSLAGSFQYQNEHYCVLHYPVRTGKNIDVFNHVLRAHLAAGRCSLRSIQFPVGLPDPQLPGHVFPETADFSEMIFDGTLNLTGAIFNGGLRVESQTLGAVYLERATFNGDLYLHVDRYDAVLTLNSATVSGAVDIAVRSGINVLANALTARGSFSLTANPISELRLSRASLHNGLQLRGVVNSNWSFAGATLKGLLDWRHCTFVGDLGFQAAANGTFDPYSDLDLSDSEIRGRLLLVQQQAVPRSIRLNRTTVHGSVHLAGALGKPRLRLVATEGAPHFSDGAILNNVDLSECLLVGNWFQELKLSNVDWATRHGRKILFDELLMRAGQPIPPTNTKEAYQILKEGYRTGGDHARSGDFHYGEMEMKRREYQNPWKRYLGLEAIYYYLSGYGTGWARALAWLVLLVFGSALVYYWLDPWAFSDNYGVALKYSLDVATFQRPELPKHVSRWSHWVRTVETIWGPLQLALFGLALRMRLRR